MEDALHYYSVPVVMEDLHIHVDLWFYVQFALFPMFAHPQL